MTTEELKIVISGQNADFSRKINESRQSLIDFGAQSEKTANVSLAAFDKIRTGIAALGLGKILKDSISTAMDAVESDSLFETSLGAYSSQAKEWSEELSDSLGLNAVELRKNTGILFTMTSSMGLASDQALSLSTNIVQLSQDMASFYNMSSEEAFTKLRAGLTGETEPLKALGILVDEATVKQYAYMNGIAQQGAELNNQQKILGRYAAIMAQTATAQGDLARTINSPANQLRLLQNEIDKAKLEMGQAFLPLAQTVLPMLTAGVQLLTPMFTKLAGGVEYLCVWWNSLNPISRTFLKIALASAVAVPLVTGAVKLFTLAQVGLHAAQALLIPQTITLGTVTKAAFGWLALAAGAIAIITSFGSIGDAFDMPEVDDSTTSLDKLSGAFDLTQSTAGTASDKIADLSDGMEDLKEKTSSLAGFDELNILDSGSGSVLGKLVTDKDLTNMDDFAAQLGDLDELIKAAQGTASKGVKVKADVFTDGFVQKLSKANSVVERIFGPKWTAFWDRVGQDMYEGINNGNWLPLLENFNGVVESLFGPKWTSFWDRVGQDMFTGINDGDWEPLLRDLSEVTEGLFGPSWNSFWDRVGQAMYAGINEGDWYPLLEVAEEGVEDLFGPGWTKFWEDVGGDMIEGLAKAFSWLDKKLEDFGEKLGYEIYDLLHPEEADEGKGTFYQTRERLYSLFTYAGKTGGLSVDQLNAAEDQLGPMKSLELKRARGSIVLPRIRQYATGGMPDYGELFVANENGRAEFISSIGNRTAVANQAQMREEMRRGVKEGVIEALSGRQSDSGDTYIIIDGEQIAYSIEKRNSRLAKRTGGR